MRLNSLSGVNVCDLHALLSTDADTPNSDYNQLTLNLLEDAARHAGLDDRLSTRVLDLTSRDALPAAPVHVYADVLYNLELSLAIARRCRVMLGGDGAAEAAVAAEAASAAADDGGVGALPRWLLLTDSQRFHSAAFLEEINQVCASCHV